MVPNKGTNLPAKEEAVTFYGHFGHLGATLHQHLRPCNKRALSLAEQLFTDTASRYFRRIFKWPLLSSFCVVNFFLSIHPRSCCCCCCLDVMYLFSTIIPVASRAKTGFSCRSCCLLLYPVPGCVNFHRTNSMHSAIDCYRPVSQACHVCHVRNRNEYPPRNGSCSSLLPRPTWNRQNEHIRHSQTRHPSSDELSIVHRHRVDDWPVWLIIVGSVGSWKALREHLVASNMVCCMFKRTEPSIGGRFPSKSKSITKHAVMSSSDCSFFTLFPRSIDPFCCAHFIPGQFQR